MPRVALAVALSLAACLPTAAGTMVAAGGVSLYHAKKAHGDCGQDKGSAHTRACVVVDMLWTVPLAVLGVALVGGGTGLGIYAAVRDDPTKM